MCQLLSNHHFISLQLHVEGGENIDNEPRPNRTQEGGYTPILLAALDYLPKQGFIPNMGLLNYLHLVWRLLIYVCSIVQHDKFPPMIRGMWISYIYHNYS